MADEADLKVGIDADVTGTKDAKALADTVALVGDAMRELVSVAKSAASSLDKVERTAAGVKNNSTAAAKGVTSLANAYTELAAAQKNVNNSAGDFKKSPTTANLVNPNAKVSPTIGNLSTAASRASAEATEHAANQLLKYQNQINAAAQAELETRRKIATAMKDARTAAVQGPKLETGTGAGSAASVAARMGAAGTFAKQDAAYVNQASEAYKTAVQNLGNYNDKLANTRYALYGFTTSLAVTGVALGAANALVVKSAADFETYIANISRTAGISGDALNRLEKDFIGLGQTIPATVADLASIGELAGQLNIPSDQIAEFTKVTAQFTATTNVGVEAAATAFGRLDTLLPDVQGNYEALGSSILNVGVNSVATESEIISTTSQIAAAGAQAKFSADQVIGLAASFASLGVAPEAARGTTIRVLSQVRAAILQGGDSLNTFAKISGQTADEFKKSWSADAGATFIELLKGLNAEGENAETTLRGLGITAVRDINALLKLSQNVEIVGDNFAYAADGFSQGTQLADSFAIKAATLNAKLQELVNSFQLLFGQLGAGGLGILGVFVDGLKGLIVLLTELASNPFVQTAATIVGAMTALSAVALVASSGVGRFIATLLAFGPVKSLVGQALEVVSTRMEVVRRSAAVAGVEMGRFRTAAIAAGTAAKGALVSTGVGIVAVAAISAIATAWETLANAMRSNQQLAKDTFGDLSDLSTALNKDTEAVKNGAEAYGTIAGTLTSTKTEAAAWTDEVHNATGGQVSLNDATTVTTTSVQSQTLAIGDNTKQLLANKLANDTNVQAIFKRNAELAKLDNGAGVLDAKGIITKSVEGDTAGAKALLEKYFADVRGLYEADKISRESYLLAVQQYKDTAAAINLTEGALSGAATQAEINTAVNEALGISSKGAADDTEDLGTAAEQSAQKMSELASAIQSAFSEQNALSQFSSDFYTLIGGIIEAGTSFNAFGEVGQANLKNLEASIVSTIAAGQVMGISATDSVAALFLELQKQGINTAALLASLPGLKSAGVDTGAVSQYLSGTKQMSGSTNQLTSSLDGMSSSAKKSAAAAKSVGGSAGSAAAEIRTLKDYASDLGSVLKRAFEIRFAPGQALDAIAKGWIDIAEASEAASKQLRDAQAALQQLSADKSIQEYFLSVAQQYGDSLRAADIQAKLADINGKIADEQKNAADATDANSKTLVGNSKAAIANRATISGLVSNYQSYIETLAASGASQETLAAESARLRQEFINQTAAMGFSRTEVDKYAVAFDDITLAINRVPRNITVSFDPNPVLQALNEVQSRKAQVASPVNIPVTTTFDDSGMQKAGRAAAIMSQMNEYYAKAAAGQGGGGGAQFFASAEFLAAKLRSNNYYSGGYTGNGGKRNEAGVVHGKEFVIDAANTNRLGLPFLNALNNGRTPAVASNPGSSSGIQVVELSAFDRQLLAAAGNVQVVIPNAGLQQSTNMSNVNSNKRGAA